MSNRKYHLLDKHGKRRVEKMLLVFVEGNGGINDGRVLKYIPGNRDYLYVVTQKGALKEMSRKLRAGPRVDLIVDAVPIVDVVSIVDIYTASCGSFPIGDASVGSFPTDGLDIHTDLNFK
jgi:hypothetical protein